MSLLLLFSPALIAPDTSSPSRVPLRVPYRMKQQLKARRKRGFR